MSAPPPSFWRHVCAYHNWKTVWIQNADHCDWCGKQRAE